MNNSDFIKNPRVQAALEAARGQVAVSRGRTSILAQRDPERRKFFKALLFAGFSGVAFLAGTSLAEATVVFQNVLFKATIGSANRTEADRWSDIKNVKDFGAVGNNVADDSIPIQAAINYATSPYSSTNAGEVFFPPGTYKVTTTIDYSTSGFYSLVLRGVGGASTITGSFAGFIFDRTRSPASPTGGDRIIEKLNITNGDLAGGGVRMGSTVGGAIRDLTVTAWQAIWACDANGGAAQSVVIENCTISAGGKPGASNGIVCTGNVVVLACDITGFDSGIRASGVGCCIFGCRFEVNRTGIKIGITPLDAASGLSGFTIQGGSFESNGTAIDFAGPGSNFEIGGFLIQGFQGSAPYDATIVTAQSITGSISGATATCSIDNAGIATLSSVTGTFLPGNNALTTDFISGGTTPTATKLTTQLTGSAGGAGTYQCNGSPGYAIRCRDNFFSNGLFAGLDCGVQAYVATIFVGDTTNRNNIVFDGVHASNAGTFGGVAWRTPTTAHTATFVGCNVLPTYLFANLPVSTNLRTGDQYFITNANQATLGLAVTAGGAPNTAGYVVWNGTAWTLMSK